MTWWAKTALVGLVVATLVLRWEASERRTDAWEARVRAEVEVEAHRRAEQAASSAASDVALVERAASARAAQVERARARLARAGITEPTLDAVLQADGESAEAVEALRSATADAVARQAAALPELKSCLTQAERSAAVAFNASSDDDIDVPAPSELCTRLLAEGP